MQLRDKTLYEFGRFRLDLAQRLVFADDELIPLTPKAFDTLLALVESQGRILEKDELLTRIWPGTFVEEGSLSQNISMLRKALGDGVDGQVYIQTIPKRGYRFVAPVSLRGNGAAPEPMADNESNGHRRDQPEGPSAVVPAHVLGRKYAFAIGPALVLATAAAFWWHARPAPLTDSDVLVLADFTNSTGDTVFDGTFYSQLSLRFCGTDIAFARRLTGGIRFDGASRAGCGTLSDSTLVIESQPLSRDQHFTASMVP